jgi:hypothetical protein
MFTDKADAVIAVIQSIHFLSVTDPQSNPPRPLTNGFKPFGILLRTSENSVSAVSMTPRR